MSSAIALENIRKSYRPGFSRKRKTAVDGLSLDVKHGEIFGLLGPNGAGKTTTLKIMLGLVSPDGGSGSLLGRPLGARDAHRLLGFLPEQPYFYGFLTAEKGLDFYGRFFGLDPRERAHRSARLLDMVGLARGSHLTLDKYSKGMLQRFGIAQALINDAELLIMDEPSSGLDPVGQKEARDLLARLKEEGKTIFISSHQLSEVENICDSVSIINLGRSVKEGRLSELLEVEGVTSVLLRGANAASKERLSPLARSVKESDGMTHLEVESGEVYRVLNAAEDLGLELVAVQPYRRTLEDLFMEAVRGDPD